MFEKHRFIKSVFNIKELPKHKLPQVILCGRSNVGKSSFINSFFNQKDLAKVSSTPGKTRSINFYEIDNKFYIVDLPGYGFAKSSKSDRLGWANLIFDFLKQSNNNKLAIQFIDSRHSPTKLDIQLNTLLHELQIPHIILLSKVDKLNQSELTLSKKVLKEKLPHLKIESNVLLYSSVKLRGRKEIARLFEEMFY